MSVYFGKDRKCAIVTMTATYASVIGLTTRIENLGHKLYIKFVSSHLDLFDNLHKKATNCCSTAIPNRKECLLVFKGSSD
jgi:hypothetical protein